MSNIYEQKPDHHYRTEIPNIVLKLGLSPYDLLVYMHIKKIAGDHGASWRSIPSFAKECGLSERQVQKSLQILKTPFELLNNRPLLISKERFKEDGSQDTNLIEIVDIWRTNGDYFRYNNKKQGGAFDSPGVVQHINQGGANCAPKEDPSQEDPSVCTVCKDEPEKKSCIKKTPIGEQISIEKDSIFREAIRQKRDWKTQEIEQAWEILCKTKQLVTDGFKFIEGTIKNLREIEKNKLYTQKQSMKKDVKCQNSQETTSTERSKTSKEQTLKNISAAQRFQEYLTSQTKTFRK